VLCALLNSSVGTWWFINNSKLRGVGVDVGVDRLRQFPLPSNKAPLAVVELLTALVVAILSEATQDATSSSVEFIIDLIDACVMESYFREHMAERDLLFHDLVAPHLAAFAPEASAAQQRDYLTHLHATLNAPSHPIRNRLLRLTADSPDLLAIIKQAGRV